jgi:drug/metabolite transporter (DMT)-like permease
MWAWLLIGEAIEPIQAIGGAVVLLGLALARQGDRVVPAPSAEPCLAPG